MDNQSSSYWGVSGLLLTAVLLATDIASQTLRINQRTPNET